MKKIRTLWFTGWLVALLLGGGGAAQAQFNVLHAFAGGTNDGQKPLGSLTLSGTALYGMTLYGGISPVGGQPAGDGVVFMVNTDGSGYTNLHLFAGKFDGSVNDGIGPNGSLTLSTNGTTLYGMTRNGGINGGGVVFQISTNGSGFSVLHDFAGGLGADDGGEPVGSLTLSGSTLYGMTQYGGTNGDYSHGVVFQINTDGSGYTNLHEFAGGTSDGSQPLGSLTLSGSTLYGMTFQGGVSNKGVVFQMNTDGSGYTNLHFFAGGANDGYYPEADLTLSGSTLYGMTTFGGVSNKGVVFQMNADGSVYTNLHSFTGGASDGGAPFGSLTLSGSTLYGMTYGGGVQGFGMVFQISTDGSGYTNLHSFALSDGIYPYGSLTLSGATLYGMTAFNGVGSQGTVFKLTAPVFVTGVANPTNGGSVSGGGNGFVGSNLVLTATASNGWQFTGWNDGTTNNPYTITVASNINYIANFAEVATITVDVNTNLGGDVTGGGLYFTGSNAVLTATASNGWLFIAWSDGATNNLYTITVPATNITYTADFLQTALVTVAVNTNLGGSVTGGGLYFTGSNAVLTATASNGWAFINWNDGSTNNPYTITTPATNITYTANFVPVATITVDVNTNVGGSVTGGGTFPVSDSVPLAAQAKLGWRFLAWNDGSTNSARSYPVVSNITLTANFTNVPFFYMQDTTGTVTRWAVNSQAVLQQYDVVGSMGSWALQALGDLNGDGQPDLFWQNNGWAITWFSQPDGNFQGLGLGYLGSWVLRAVADVDGDGVADLLWQNTTGDVVVWYMNSNATLRAGAVLAQPGPLWQLQAAADINGDGKADLFWQNNGWVVAWLSQTNSTYEGLGLGNMGTWELRTAGDVNGDGIPDLIWQNPAGWTAAWYMTTNCTQSSSAGLGNTGSAKIIAVE